MNSWFKEDTPFLIEASFKYKNEITRLQLLESLNTGRDILPGLKVNKIYTSEDLGQEVKKEEKKEEPIVNRPLSTKKQNPNGQVESDWQAVGSDMNFKNLPNIVM